ncbi:MAG: 30S ribosomal protein S2 [Ignavibacteriae bacterium]|nr:30S ribosomal protein S2 [Ignavibacteriota bacterium]
MNHYADIEQLLESGAHFGHLTRRWNPKMEKYIFGERNGIHIIDLRKSQILIDIARNAVYDAAAKGKIVLFVGTKTQAQEVIKEQAKRGGMHYVTERWLGGMLTNFTTIRKSIKRLTSIDKMEVDGTFEKITKKEKLMLSRERDRLRKVFGGIEDMTRLPGAIFVVDIKKEHIAVKEAKILDIPVIAMVDSNCDPEEVDFPIPANDDSIKTIEIISKIMIDAVLEGSELAKARQAEFSAESERGAKESESGEDRPKVQRRMRERRAGKSRQRSSRDEHIKTDDVEDIQDAPEEQTEADSIQEIEEPTNE